MKNFLIVRTLGQQCQNFALPRGCAARHRASVPKWLLASERTAAIQNLVCERKLWNLIISSIRTASSPLVRTIYSSTIFYPVVHSYTLIKDAPQRFQTGERWYRALLLADDNHPVKKKESSSTESYFCKVPYEVSLVVPRPVSVVSTSRRIRHHHEIRPIERDSAGGLENPGPNLVESRAAEIKGVTSRNRILKKVLQCRAHSLNDLNL